MQFARDGRQTAHANGDVFRLFFEDFAALVLCEFPPVGGLANRDQRRKSGAGPINPCHLDQQRSLFGLLHIDPVCFSLSTF
jgi:hypothetical protein